MSKNIIIDLDSDVYKWLESIAKTQKISQTEALFKAIATQKFLSDEIAKNNKILIQRNTGKIEEVIFK